MAADSLASSTAEAKRASSGGHTGASEHFAHRFSLSVTGGHSSERDSSRARATACRRRSRAASSTATRTVLLVA